MRRAACWLAVLVSTGTARAEPWNVTAEAGLEVDSNVERREADSEFARTTSAVSRVGAKVDRRGDVAGGALSVALSALTRLVHNDELSVENVALLGGDIRWLRPLGDRPVSAGFALTAVDAVPISESVGARTFRYLGADGLLAIRGGEGRALTVALGGRSFNYKPDSEPMDGDVDDDYDWSGPSANARLDLMLWQSASRTRSLALATALGVELRSYQTNALMNAAAPGEMAAPGPTDIRHRDRSHRVALDLTWTGHVMVAVGYQLQAVDSNSFTWSVMRHRATVLATIPLPLELYANALISVQFDHQLDGKSALDPEGGQLITLDDETRSSAQLRLSRPLSPTWSIESRAATWRDLGNHDHPFRRSLVYVGVIYAR
ncbi:MAG: hypothetical protein AB7O24_15345 [Kofleriaceae bacterium]